MNLLAHMFITGALLLMPCLLQAQPPQTAEEVSQRLTAYHLSFPQEKVFVHHDKSLYLLGETIWFKAYLFHAGHHRAETPSQLVYVDLWDANDSLVATRNIRIREGSGAGDISIPFEWKPGRYLLQAYTSYMRNYDSAYLFREEILIQDVYEQPTDSLLNRAARDAQGLFDIHFFPEGGDMVAGLPSRIGFKATDPEGNGIELSGTVQDASGQQVAQFSTLRYGLGSFELQPQAGQAYTARITYQGQSRDVPLPAVQPAGYSLRADVQGPAVILTVRTNRPEGLNGAFAVAHLRGQVFGTLADMQGGGARFRLPLADIPMGVAHFTLFDGQARPVAERLVFVNPPGQNLDVSVKAENTFAPRAQASWEFVFRKDLMTPLAGADLSVAITDMTSQAGDLTSQDIRTYALLTSDLRGRIEDPGYYFEENDPGRQLLLDVLMRTQGWRRFNWQDLLQEREPDLSYLNEDGFTFAGFTTRAGKPDKPVAADLRLSALSEQFFMDQAQSKEDGSFFFLGYHFPDTTDVVIQANVASGDDKKSRKKNKKKEGPSGNRNVDILLTDFGQPAPHPEWAFSPTRQVKEVFADQAERIFDEEGWRQLMQMTYGDLRTFELGAVVIEAEKKEPTFDRFKRPNMLYRRPDNRLVVDSMGGNVAATTVFEMIRGRVPGVEIVGSPGINQTARIRGNNSINLNTTAFITLDGVPISTATANSLNVQNIDFIDVIKGLRATSIYGADGANGVIAIYTRRPGDRKIPIDEDAEGILNIQHPGYYQAREFYVPNYDEPDPRHSRPDYRTTLYWNPSLRTDEQGRVDISCFTGDLQGRFQVLVQGMTPEGRPLVQRHEFTVEE